jgi:hypothetical protein
MHLVLANVKGSCYLPNIEQRGTTMTKKQKQQFASKLARRSNERVPNSRLTFAELADLNESYIRRCLDEAAQR